MARMRMMGMKARRVRMMRNTRRTPTFMMRPDEVPLHLLPDADDVRHPRRPQHLRPVRQFINYLIHYLSSRH